MGAGEYRKGWGSRLGAGTWKASSLHNRFRFVFYKLHSGSSGQDGLVELRLGQDRPQLWARTVMSIFTLTGEKMNIRMIRDEGPGNTL